MINDENAQKWIIILAIITLGSTGMAYLKPPPRKLPIRPKRALFGGFAAMFILSVVADLDAKLGVLLASLVAGGAFFEYGLPVINSYYSEKKTPQQEQKEITEHQQIKSVTGSVHAGTGKPGSSSTRIEILPGFGFNL